MVYTKYTTLLNGVIAKYDKNMPVFYNCGNIPRDDKAWIEANTQHLELESLPTGGWGYDHFPMSAAYSRTLGREFVGMTGKFHKSWGEFGGYKHPNALIYETALSLANGAKCSVGDQLHPTGKFEPATYRLIGKAYAEVEKKEPWCSEARAVTDIAIYTTYTDKTKNDCPDIGANRLLLEGKYLYNIIDAETALSDYKLIIFPDTVCFDKALSERVEKYIKDGGKILLSGKSGLCGEKFFCDFGIDYKGENPLDATYLVPAYDMEPNGTAPYLMYDRNYAFDVKDEKVQTVAYCEDSYFNRTLRHFCSHANTPNNPGADKAGAVICGNIGYIGWNIFGEYGKHGAYHQKKIVCDMLDKLLGDKKTLWTNLPSNGVTTLMEQTGKGRLVNHLLYCVTKMRGCVEVIEDAVPIYGTRVSIKLENAPKRVYIAPENKDIEYKYENGILSYTVEKFTLHTMVVIDLQ